MESKQRERPEAIVLLEEVWPKLSEANKTRLATMAETIAFMHEPEERSAQQAAALPSFESLF